MTKKEIKQLWKLFDEQYKTSYDEDDKTLIESHDGEFLWNDDFAYNCPEDLVWRRNISKLAFDFFKLGYLAGKNET